MQAEDIKRLILLGLPDCQVRVSGDGRHFEAIVVSAMFVGKGMLEQHRMVYATLGERMQGGEIHALSIRSYTPDEWRRVGGADLC